MTTIRELEKEMYELEKKWDEKDENIPFQCQELREIVDVRKELFYRAKEGGATTDVIQNARDEYMEALKRYIRCLRENL